MSSTSGVGPRELVLAAVGVLAFFGIVGYFFGKTEEQIQEENNKKKKEQLSASGGLGGVPIGRVGGMGGGGSGGGFSSKKAASQPSEADIQMEQLLKGFIQKSEEYLQAGKYPESELMQRQAINLLEQTLSPNHPYSIIMVQNLVSKHLRPQYKFQEMETLITRSYAILVENNLEPTLQMNCILDLIEFNIKLFNLAKAEKLCYELINTIDKSSISVSSDCHNKAYIYDSIVQIKLRKNLFQDAEANAIKAISYLEKLNSGPTDPSLIYCTSRLLQSIIFQGRINEGNEQFEAILQKLGPDDHEKASSLLFNQASANFEMGRKDFAQALMTRSITEHSLAENTRSLYLLASLALEADKVEEAKGYIEQLHKKKNVILSTNFAQTTMFSVLRCRAVRQGGESTGFIELVLILSMAREEGKTNVLAQSGSFVEAEIKHSDFQSKNAQILSKVITEADRTSRKIELSTSAVPFTQLPVNYEIYITIYSGSDKKTALSKTVQICHAF